MAKTAFKAERDGFAFINSWSFDETERTRLRETLSGSLGGATQRLGSRLPAFLQGAALNQVQGWLNTALPDSYGLCGGMAFAAKDYFLARRTPPRGSGITDHPDPRTPHGKLLRDYLWRRQLESLAPNAPTLIAWMIMLHLPDFVGGADWVLAQTKKEWVKLKAILNSGEPWPLCLIGSSLSPFDNHQVLAIGYEDRGDDTGSIYVYDMNCPGGEQSIRLDMRGTILVAEESCASTARGPLRGFFCEVYSPAVPPMGL